MEVFLGVICVILIYVTWEVIKQKQKEKENERRRKQKKARPPRKGNRKANRSNSKAANSK
jgi:amino acid permease